MITESDKKLVLAAQAGSIESFGKLASRYFNPMVAVAYTVLSDHHLAEDAAQEALAKALSNLLKLKKPAKFAPWLRQICRNIALDMAAKRSKQIITDDLSNIAEQTKSANDSAAVRQAIASLEPDARELVILRYYNNCSYDQITAVLGISKPAINGRLLRAKKKIAQHLQHSKNTE